MKSEKLLGKKEMNKLRKYWKYPLSLI